MVWESGFRCVLHPSWLLLHYTHYQPCVFQFCYFFLFVCAFASSFLSFLCLLIAFTLFVIVSCFCLTISSSYSCHNLFSVLLPSISSFNLQLVFFYVEIKSCPILKCHYSDFFRFMALRLRSKQSWNVFQIIFWHPKHFFLSLQLLKESKKGQHFFRLIIRM